MVAEDDGIGDDLLRLVFVACHPVLSTEARAALSLWLLGGLTIDEIARAFLLPNRPWRNSTCQDRPGTQRDRLVSHPARKPRRGVGVLPAGPSGDPTDRGPTRRGRHLGSGTHIITSDTTGRP